MTVQTQQAYQYFSGPITVGTILSIVDFTYIDNSHVSVKLRDSEAIWEYGVDYIVRGAGTSERTVTILRRVQLNEVLTVYLDIPLTQGVSPEEGGNFPASTNEFVLDKLTGICQMLHERVTRSVQASIDVPFDGTILNLAQNKGKALIINQLGTGIDYSAYKIDDLEYIANRLYESITKVDTVANNIGSVTITANNIQGVNTTANNIQAINTTADNIGSVVITANNIQDVSTVANSIQAINTTADNIQDVNTVADDIQDVNTVADSIQRVNTTADNIGSVVITANNIQGVNTVANSIQAINTTADNIQDINTVANSIQAINTTADNIQGVNTVADDITHVVTASENIVAIQNAAILATELYAVLDGGRATPVATNIVDGGNAASIYEGIIDGGNSKTVGTIIGDIQNTMRLMSVDIATNGIAIIELQQETTTLDSQVAIAKTDIEQLQTEVSTKQEEITGAATSILDTDLAANKVVISSNLGKVTIAPISVDELNKLSGVAENIQDAIDTTKLDIQQLGLITTDLQNDFETIYAVLDGGRATPVATNIVDGGNALQVSTNMVDGGGIRSGSLLNEATAAIRSLVARVSDIEFSLSSALATLNKLTSYTVIDGGNALNI